jgi:RNase H-fold protein (predicted Holliday junction resolvase)
MEMHSFRLYGAKLLHYFSTLGKVSLSLLLICIMSTGIPFQQNRARISVDYGPRLIGIAKGNILGSVEPHGTIINTGNLTQLSQHVIDLANSISAVEIIIGIPLDSDGVMHHNVRNFNGKLCLKFSDVLSSVVVNTNTRPLKTLLFDERYTTKEAKMRLRYDKTVKGSLDAMSALCLLERYIEDEGQGAIEAKPCVFPIPKDLECFDYSVVKKYIRDLHWSKPLSSPKKEEGGRRGRKQTVSGLQPQQANVVAVDGREQIVQSSVTEVRTTSTGEEEEEEEEEEEDEEP